jgi:hypothetical protein
MPASGDPAIPWRRNRVDILVFLAWSLLVIHGVALLWPVNTLLMALAYKVQNGQAPLGMEAREFWSRSAFAALALAVLSLLLVGAAYLLVGAAELPGGPIHLILLLLYLPAAVALVFWLFALDDVLQALSIFAIYILLPGAVLLVLAWWFSWFDRIREQVPWLLPSS